MLCVVSNLTMDIPKLKYDLKGKIVFKI